jgi:hypothetical protein
MQTEPIDPAIPLEAVIECAKSIPIPHRSWALWAADCAERALSIFESKYPDDNRPRLAIEAARGGGAANAADAATYAADAANAAANAANAANAADAATYAADAATYAAYAANAANAADAAAYAADAAAYAADAAARAAYNSETTWQAIRLMHYIQMEN